MGGHSVGRAAGRALAAAGWVVIGTLAVFAVMRVAAWDALEPLIVVNALTSVVYLPAWLVAVGAALARRWLLVASALAVVGAQLAFVAPELLAAEPVPGWASRATTVSLFDANVDKSIEFSPGYSTAIERARPDLLTFEELTPGSFRHLARTGVLAMFPYRCNEARYGATGFLVASRLPMTRCVVHSVTWRAQRIPYMVSATLRTRAGPVDLRVVHTLAPLPTSWPEWVTALEAIGNSVRTSPSGEILMVGDFNATWGSRGFVRLLGYGLTDAAAARGDAFEMTWPDGALVPPFARIDHVLTGRDLAVTAIDTHPGFGSDHRYLTVTVAVRR